MDQENVGAEVQGELFKRRRSEIPDAERVSILQEKLYQKAKQERGYKFYVLYDKMFIPYMLREAWKSVKSNDGSPGVDGITIEKVEDYGVDNYLKELGEDDNIAAALKGEIVRRGVEALTGLSMPVFEKRRFQRGAIDDAEFGARFPADPAVYRQTFLDLYAR